ncbi:MAG: hypothetical protein IIB19_03890 [Chloroflexi bacterium]|nr:hypothetical protein [Chloroflexota bacterium]
MEKLIIQYDAQIRLHSANEAPPIQLDVSAIGTRGNPGQGWAGYPLGVFRFFAERTGLDRGVDLAFAGDLPIAAGLSSSAAIEVVTAFALNELHGAGLDFVELACLGFRAETEHIGLKVGIMDQFASALGRRGQVLRLDCSDRSFDHIPIDGESVEILVMDSKVPRKLGDTGYDTRVAECAAAHEVLREVRDLEHLAAYTFADLDQVAGRLAGPLRMRAEHVVGEVLRVEQAVQALRANDLEGLGRGLDARHPLDDSRLLASDPISDDLPEVSVEVRVT